MNTDPIQSSEIVSHPSANIPHSQSYRRVTLLLGIFLLLFIATSGMYYLTKSQNKSENISVAPTSKPLSPTPTPPTDSKDNWETFTRSDDISFKYPSWLKDQYRNPPRTGLGNFDRLISEDNTYILSYDSFPNFNEFGGRPKYSSLQDIIKENPSYITQLINIDRHEAIKILPYTINPGSIDETTTSTVYFFTTSLNNLSFVNSLSLEIISSDQTKVRIGNEIFTQILSTFKFTD